MAFKETTNYHPHLFRSKLSKSEKWLKDSHIDTTVAVMGDEFGLYLSIEQSIPSIVRGKVEYEESYASTKISLEEAKQLAEALNKAIKQYEEVGFEPDPINIGNPLEDHRYGRPD